MSKLLILSEARKKVLAEGKVLIICGPTATGKTSLAIKLAKKFKAELISADSRQVYQGMDIGTGKDLPVISKFQMPNSKFKKLNLGYYLFNGIPVWLLDVVKPNQDFSVSQYYCLAWQAIREIWKKDKLPILVGGTGFYIKAVVDGLATKDIPPNPKIRQEMKDWSAGQLYQYLENFDPLKAASLNKSDRYNPRRLIRAIEIVAWKKENPGWQPKKHKTPSVLFIGLKTKYKKLYQRIDERVARRIRMRAEREVRDLVKKGYSWDLPAMNSIGYIQWKPFFEKKTTKKKVVKRWQFAEHAYARRQMTWFRKALRQAQSENKRVYWFDIGQKRWQDRIVKLVGEWLTNQNA